MCGRFTLTQPEAIADHFGVEVAPVPPPRFNIAPGQPLGVICQGTDQPRQFRLMQWGLIPSWAKDPTLGRRLINARAETAPSKPSFRSAFRHRRCLLPADGFYEWQTQTTGKQPYYFKFVDHRLFALAGLWESWQGLETCTILTTEANALLTPIHPRMPLILDPQQYASWLDPQTPHQALLPFLQPYSPAQMVAYPVSRWVNRPDHDSAACLHPQS
ncbi:SOS response-associated peptidase [Lyngbya confervoides]|uniref:Abasic site processing protein n=1 Tax=Lyngbya confervoides BDU141951 TaxID=1574623 RepID=A0ABD4T953_9CYAN|nr:SOS response-associated peptidase [Lyngbya confervoides]MCM1984852.1 SOS response-associated peptidase [Lyngbya confervoides BDU141951]